MIFGTLLFELIPGVLLSFFDASDNMLSIGIPALRIIAIHFPIAGVSIILISVFQAFSKSFYSFIVSICRQLVVLIPTAYLLSLTRNVTNVWWSFPAAEVVSLIMNILFFRHIYSTIFGKKEKTE